MSTPAQEKMARKEGWKLVGGVPFLCYDKNGFCPFHSMDQLYRHLYVRSHDSEFHRGVFSTLPWTIVDGTRAHSRGWTLNMGVRIVKAGPRFASNEGAEAFVLKDAEANDPLAMKALRTIAKNRLLGR